MVARKLQLKPDLFAWSTTDFSGRDNVMVRGEVDGATYFHDSAMSLFARMKQMNSLCCRMPAPASICMAMPSWPAAT